MAAKTKIKTTTSATSACCQILEPAAGDLLPIGAYVYVRVRVFLTARSVREVYASVVKDSDVPADPLDLPYWAGSLERSLADPTIWHGWVWNWADVVGPGYQVLAWVISVNCRDSVPVSAQYPVYLAEWAKLHGLKPQK